MEFFVSYLLIQWANSGHWLGDNLTHKMLINHCALLNLIPNATVSLIKMLGSKPRSSASFEVY